MLSHPVPASCKFGYAITNAFLHDPYEITFHVWNLIKFKILSVSARKFYLRAKVAPEDLF